MGSGSFSEGAAGSSNTDDTAVAAVTTSEVKDGTTSWSSLSAEHCAGLVSAAEAANEERDNFIS